MTTIHKTAVLLLVIAGFSVAGCLDQQPAPPSLSTEDVGSKDAALADARPKDDSLELPGNETATELSASKNVPESAPKSSAASDSTASKTEPAEKVARRYTRPAPPTSSAPEKGAYKEKPSTLIIPDDPARVIHLTFNDIRLDMKADSVFKKSMLTETVKKLDGRKVKISGFIFEGILQQKGIKRFPLLKNTECKFGPGGQAFHIIQIDLDSGVTANFTNRPVAVEGVFTIKPWMGPDKNTWVLYHLQGSSVK